MVTLCVGCGQEVPNDDIVSGTAVRLTDGNEALGTNTTFAHPQCISIIADQEVTRYLNRTCDETGCDKPAVTPRLCDEHLLAAAADEEKVEPSPVAKEMGHRIMECWGCGASTFTVIRSKGGARVALCDNCRFGIGTV